MTLPSDFHSETRAARRELEEASREPFLQDWLAKFLENEAELKALALSPQEREALANREHFRTWRAFLECRKQIGMALRLFVKDSCFQRLWQFLRAQDKEWQGFSYSPANGGVPMRILRCIESWHRAPKFTRAELLAHRRRIAQKADELMLLLGQVSPSEEYGDSYSRVSIPPDHKPRVLDFLDRLAKGKVGAHGERLMDMEPFRQDNVLNNLIAETGINTIWVLGLLRAECRRPPETQMMPRKVRAKDAMKTYFIWHVDAAPMFGARIPAAMLAEIVGLLTNSDCTDDDVRKARKQREKDAQKWAEEALAAEDSRTKGLKNLPRRKQ